MREIEIPLGGAQMDEHVIGVLFQLNCNEGWAYPPSSGPRP